MYDKSKDQNLLCNLKCKHLQRIYKLFKNLFNFFCKHICNFFPFFFITWELHHLHKAMGGGSNPPKHKQHNEPTITPTTRQIDNNTIRGK